MCSYMMQQSELICRVSDAFWPFSFLPFLFLPLQAVSPVHPLVLRDQFGYYHIGGLQPRQVEFIPSSTAITTIGAQ